jgi:cytosine/uracil/thiamine/allantoin permease
MFPGFFVLYSHTKINKVSRYSFYLILFLLTICVISLNLTQNSISSQSLVQNSSPTITKQKLTKNERVSALKAVCSIPVSFEVAVSLSGPQEKQET